MNASVQACLCSARILHLHTVQDPCLGNGTTHCGLALYTLINLIKIIFHRPTQHSQYPAETSFSRYSSCVDKLAIRVNHLIWDRDAHGACWELWEDIAKRLSADSQVPQVSELMGKYAGPAVTTHAHAHMHTCRLRLPLLPREQLEHMLLSPHLVFQQKEARGSNMTK